MNNSSTLPMPFGWFHVGYGDDLKVGDVKALEYFGKQLVMFRTEAGEVKILDAYCPHLGAHLGYGGKVHGESIACPFHGWEFNGSGQCTAVPYAKNMPPKVAGGKEAIYAYPVVERNKFIFVWYHPQQAAPTYEITPIKECEDADWHIAQTEEWVLRGQIQEIAENGIDAAHFVSVHGALEVPAADKIVFDGVRRNAKYENIVPKMLPDGSLDPEGGTTLVYLTSIAEGPSLGVQFFTGAVQTVLLGSSTPIDNERVIIRFAFFEPKTMDEGQRVLASFAKMELCRQVEADMPIWENKVYKPDPILCDGDGPVHLFRKWFSQFYAPSNEPTKLTAVA